MLSFYRVNSNESVKWANLKVVHFVFAMEVGLIFDLTPNVKAVFEAIHEIFELLRYSILTTVRKIERFHQARLPRPDELNSLRTRLPEVTVH